MLNDLAVSLFWIWYNRRYVGQPHITGRFRSRKAIRFFQRYFFDGLMHYFSTRVVVCTPYTLPCDEFCSEANESQKEEEAEPTRRSRPVPHRVNLYNVHNQYLFSFHPHGVFPGTTVTVPNTVEWEKVIGHNSYHFISIHCADVVFSVPMMR